MAETCLAASALDNSTAVLKLHCDLAKAFLPMQFLILPDDAQFRRGPQVAFHLDLEDCCGRGSYPGSIRCMMRLTIATATWMPITASSVHSIA